ncbi:26S proteasome non-ATPase regulatory subunit 2, putative [Eimeria tenella]|uniref:26S proteasome non-ATPase regulatory subunit 2, putative n=1 Tax=Eimeria tenella TaxID=5802 RepID=U6KJB1_EIMTE|nr:26S proteasome non-ATPase regulatory subunit 2, putative [Eimeria tenella]CDJ38130.1 26S proteasome non-ATPase regulatory subunit 2, putative [Eimeria tenella]|eukprot:XP_013228968.1 26S proteasome non-ATPase regulatory subunit 2, putative [Eimeria tenella]
MAGENDKREAVKVAVPSKDPKKAGKKAKGTEEMTEDDKKIQENIDLLVERTCDSDLEIVALALETLSRELKAATSSMTSVPKPLKFLMPHIDRLVDRYKQLPDGTNLKRDFAMVLSVTCTTSGDSRRLSLHFCLEAECKDVTSWGYEYLRNLSGQIAGAFAELQLQEAVTGTEQQNAAGGTDGRASAASGEAVEMDGPAPSEQQLNGVTKEVDTQEKPVSGLASVVVPLPTAEQLLQLVEEIVPYYMQHNAEVDAIDLLTEVEKPQSLLPLLDTNNYQRVVAYLLSLSNYAASPEESVKLQMVAFDALMQQQQHFDAMRVALRLGDRALVDKVVKDCKDSLVQQQLALLLCRQRVDVEFEDEKLQRLVSGSKTSPFFRFLAKELDVLEPKEPEDVFKRHLEDPHGRRARLAGLESAQQNLASSFVNAFVNCGFGTDKLMTTDGNSWLFKNKDRGLLSTTASLGALCLWNVDEALQHLDKHQYSSDVNVKAGALLGFGVSSCNVRHECDAALALLKDHLEATEMTAETPLLKAAAAIGLGCAYAGSCREDVLELLTLAILDGSLPLECSAFASLSLGLCFVGSASADAAEAILTALMDRCTAAKAMDSPLGHFLSVGLGLVFLGTRDAAEGALCAVAALPHAAFSAAATRIIEGLAAAGSGDVLKVQRMLGVCAESRPDGHWRQKQKELNNEQHPEEATTGDAAAANGTAAPGVDSAAGSAVGRAATVGSSSESTSGATNTTSTTTVDDDEDHPDDTDQAVAVLNIALIAFAEEMGAEMSLRLYDHILQYADAHMKRAVPLAVALQHPSNPKPQLIDLLSKLSHDADPDTALNAIFAMGILGAGTNHSRIASLLRQLASYYGKDPSALFVVRLSQGLLYLGKGLLHLGALHSDRQVICRVALGALAIISYSALLMRHTILGKFHFILYYLFPAVQPRWLVTVAERVEGVGSDEKPDPALKTEGPAVVQDEAEAAGIDAAMETDGAMTDKTPTMEGDEDLRMLPIPVRVGEAVDVVAQVGRQPKTITGFQTHTSPVLLNFSERAELATDEYLPVARVLEGIVLLRKNPEYQPPKAQ